MAVGGLTRPEVWGEPNSTCTWGVVVTSRMSSSLSPMGAARPPPVGYTGVIVSRRGSGWRSGPARTTWPGQLLPGPANIWWPGPELLKSLSCSNLLVWAAHTACPGLYPQQQQPRHPFQRDWSLITGRGGGTWSFTPTKRGGGKSFSHAEGGGHKKFWGSFYVVAWSLSHIVGEARKVSTL